MNILIFRTNIKTKNKVKAVKPLFNNHPVITAWSINIEDIDSIENRNTRWSKRKGHHSLDKDMRISLRSVARLIFKRIK